MAKKVHEAYSKNPKRKDFTFDEKVVLKGRDLKQNLTAKSRCTKLYENKLTTSKCVVMDDETCCFSNSKYITSQDFYTV